MRIHLDGISFRILLGLGAGIILFTYVAGLYGDVVTDPYLDPTYIEIEEIDGARDLRDTGSGFLGRDGYVGRTWTGLSSMHGALDEAPEVFRAFYLLLFVAVVMIVLRAFDISI